ncbi:PREDICTED: uncharacterized protein LOC104744714 [Camelina sativa]|uniref:Uncharacterized protein LOC104744714 n=1 Tax=Camelina sativa TaxID=90675 RepID=A0ABM0W0U5_CAMSA|nr:PREDICTED: uncharacterized protein LOC104744714 [Camelina sativa]
MDLKNCAPETMTTIGDSTKFLEATEPMEEEASSAFLAKRKAESDSVEASGDEESEDKNEEEEEEEEEEPVSEALAHYYKFLARREAGPVEEEEESGDEKEENVDEKEESVMEYSYSSGGTLTITPKWWVEPEWDVDSFDGLEYDSSQEEDAMSDEELERKWRRFKRQLIQSKGFYVEPELIPMYSYSRINSVVSLELSAGGGQTYRDYFAERAINCVQKYNQENSAKNGFNVEFVEVVRGTFRGGPKSKSYITFMAREKPDGPLVEYQCKAWSTFVRHEHYPILCRPAPPIPTPNLSNQN